MAIRNLPKLGTTRKFLSCSSAQALFKHFYRALFLKIF